MYVNHCNCVHFLHHQSSTHLFVSTCPLGSSTRHLGSTAWSLTSIHYVSACQSWGIIWNTCGWDMGINLEWPNILTPVEPKRQVEEPKWWVEEPRGQVEAKYEWNSGGGGNAHSYNGLHTTWLLWRQWNSSIWKSKRQSCWKVYFQNSYICITHKENREFKCVVVNCDGHYLHSWKKVMSVAL